MKKVATVFLTVLFFLNLFYGLIYADTVINMDPEITNETYEKMIIGEKNELKNAEDIKSLEYHDSLLWASKGWTRGLLITGLMTDLQKNNLSLFNKYFYSEKTNYVMLNSNSGNGYTYTVFIIVGNNAILFFYNPEEGTANYSEKIDLSKSDLQIFALLAKDYWKVTADDLLSISEVWS